MKLSFKRGAHIDFSLKVTAIAGKFMNVLAELSLNDFIPGMLSYHGENANMYHGRIEQIHLDVRENAKPPFFKE